MFERATSAAPVNESDAPSSRISADTPTPRSESTSRPVTKADSPGGGGRRGVHLHPTSRALNGWGIPTSLQPIKAQQTRASHLQETPSGDQPNAEVGPLKAENIDSGANDVASFPDYWAFLL